MSEIQVYGVTEDVGRQLAHIYQSHGSLRESDVLEDARNESSPLHGYFEWSDSAAAEQYRLQQAANLIRRVKVKVILDEKKPPVRVRAFIAQREVADKSEMYDPGSYIAIQDVAGQTALESALRLKMERDLLQLKKRYDDTSLLFEVAQEIFGE